MAAVLVRGLARGALRLGQLLGHLMVVAARTAQAEGLTDGYRLVVPSRVPSPETGKDLSGIKLPPWLGNGGTSPEKESPATVPALPPTPPTPAEKPSQSVPQWSRVTHNWQKEILVDPLDSQPGKDLGSEDSQHDYHGLPIHQFLSSLTDSSLPKDCPPLRALLLWQGQRKATLASILYEKYRQVCTPT
ncbi:hypothetical protein DUI87_06483 [Hirundo rustica rustica]|uniref:Uncharacterized protein n=1 Tax=Hirundo rustica rustica TaxID=333673 RepID=A0A3M0KUD7_HIRRU|nr:hypothetical protein DUI87_06483 [Hirundo rustica rustica]